MNLRILKKLSKRAAPLLLELQSSLELTHYVTDREDDGHTGTRGHDRKHWRRHRARHADTLSGYICLKARRADLAWPYIHMAEPWTPSHGTPMVGWMSGYYEPEWEEQTAWEFLRERVHELCGEYKETGEIDGYGCPVIDWSWHERVRNPGAILRKARQLSRRRD